MKSNLSYETIKINKVIFDKSLEQMIDFEYQLPDYYTGIFKVLRFTLEPYISSCRISDKQFVVDGNASMKLLYVDEEGGNVKLIHQNIPFSKTVNLEEEILDPIFFYNVKTVYKNCKIISPRKLDLKATLTISIKIEAQKEENLLKDSNKDSLQFKYQPIKITSNQLFTTQQFNINEQIELDITAKEILDVRINIFDNEFKIISNKIIAKSTANIEIVYYGDEKNKFITQKTAIPINTMIDISDINEKYIYNVKYDIISTNFEILQEGKSIKLEAEVVVTSHSSLQEQVEVVIDSFSTKYEIKPITKEFNFSAMVSTINENITLDQTINNVNLQKLLDLTVDISDVNCNQIDKKLDVTAKLNVVAIGANKEQTIESFSKSIPIEFKINNSNIEKEKTTTTINDIKITDLIPNFREDGTLDFKIRINVKGYVFINGNIIAVDNININKDKLKAKSTSALTLYYPKSGDQIWDIAKHFSTSPKMIIDANNLENDFIKEETMIIIPIV